jgi:hypothetical protein
MASRRVGLDRVVLLVGLLLAAPSIADTNPIDADRPGRGEPAFVLERGSAQIEMGATFEHDAEGENADTWSLPEPLLRVGVLDRLELRLAAEGLLLVDPRGDSNEVAGSDLELSTKLRFVEQSGWRPETSLLAGLTFPTGGHSVTSDGYDPFGLLIASWEIGEGIDLDANLGLSAPSQGPDDSDRVVETFVAATGSVSLFDAVGAFLEYYGTLRGSGRSDEHGIDGGFTYTPIDDVQLDVSAGMGLSSAASDYFVGFGIAWRFHTP